jgi:hypothetical protein
LAGISHNSAIVYDYPVKLALSPYLGSKDAPVMAPAAGIESTALQSEPSRGQLPTLESVDGVDRRTCTQALNYWREIAAPRRYPSLEQVTRDSAGALWEHLFIVAVTGQPGEYTYMRAGAVLARALGFDPTGRKVSDVLPREIRNRVLYFQKTAVDLASPVDEVGKWLRADSNQIIYRSVVLPLSDDQRQVNYLLGAFSFRLISPH